MSSNFKQRKNATKKIICTVDGYIHEHQTYTRRTSSFYNIPQLINYLVTCYYNASDSWNQKQIAKNMKIIRNCVMSTVTTTHGNAFLTNVIEEDKYMWKFRINTMPSLLTIGIWNLQSQYPGTGKYYDMKIKNFTYCFDADLGLVEKNKNNNVYDYRAYGVDCTDGDIIKMILNMNDLTLSYAINGKNYGVAFTNIDKTSYKAVIYMYSTECFKGCIELLNSGYC